MILLKSEYRFEFNWPKVDMNSVGADAKSVESWKELPVYLAQ